MRMTHSQRLENWLGAEQANALSANFRNWYGPPVALDVPGNVYVGAGGDFCGEFRGSAQVTPIERARELVRSIERQRFLRRYHRQRGAFAGLSALITAKTSGKSVTMQYVKAGTAATGTNQSMDAWMYAGQPAAGVAGAAAPGGTANSSANTGSLPFINAVANANTSHFVNASMLANTVNHSLMLYDRLFSVAKTMNSTATEAVTGVPTRYQNTVAGSLDSAAGNFLFPAVNGTVLPATAHNWTVCQYTNQGATTGQSAPSAAGVSACAINQLDLGPPNWFMPLAAGDSGIKALTQMQCSALVATGVLNFVIGHPIAIMTNFISNTVSFLDGVASAFNLQQVYDNACLAFMELPKPAATATTYSGLIMTVSE